MFCRKCGARIDDDAMYCTECGEPVKTGRKQPDAASPYGQTAQEQRRKSQEAAKRTAGKFAKKPENGRKTRKKEKKKSGKSGGHRIRNLLLILCICALGIGIVSLLLFQTGILDKDLLSQITASDSHVLEDTDYRVERPDVEAYFEKNTEIIGKTSVQDAPEVMTEQDVQADMEARGFGSVEMIPQYTMDGKVVFAEEYSADPQAKHPMYQGLYTSANGELWVLYVIRNRVMANPASYNLARQDSVQLMLTEDDTVMSYDSESSLFYETIPKEKEIRIRKTDRIDAETLNSLTVEELAR